MITIENELMRVSIEDLGAELRSIYSKQTNTEYLWQGDPKYWMGRAYNLFPLIGRLHEGKYDLYGKTYEMAPHGLIRKRVLSGKKIDDTTCVFTIVPDEPMLQSYPHDFVYSIEYKLVGKKVEMTISVENKSETTMFFSIGGHPGFNIPFEGGVYEDYMVVFPKGKNLKWHKFSENILMSGEVVDYPLENNEMHLKHELFGLDAVVLEGTNGVATIQKKNGTKKLTVHYPTMDYMGVWHKPQSDAPFVCLEPWSTLPARDGVREDFERKSDLISLESGKTHQTKWDIEIED